VKIGGGQQKRKIGVPVNLIGWSGQFLIPVSVEAATRKVLETNGFLILELFF